MKEYTFAELEKVIESHGIKKCHLCGEYEGPRDPFAGLGGIQGDDMGMSNGKPAHARCAINRKRT
jgi:hypothetical protein